MQKNELAVELANDYGFNVEDVQRLLNCGISPEKVVRVLKKKGRKQEQGDPWSIRRETAKAKKREERQNRRAQEVQRRIGVLNHYGDSKTLGDEMIAMTLRRLFYVTLYLDFACLACMLTIGIEGFAVLSPFLLFATIVMCFVTLYMFSFADDKYYLGFPRKLFDALVVPAITRCFVKGADFISREQIEGIVGAKKAVKLAKKRKRKMKVEQRKSVKLESHCRVVRMYFGSGVNKGYDKDRAYGFQFEAGLIALLFAIISGLAFAVFLGRFLPSGLLLKIVCTIAFWTVWVYLAARAAYALIWNDLRGFELAVRRLRRREEIKLVMSS